MNDSERFLVRWSRLKSEEKAGPGGNSGPEENGAQAGSEGFRRGGDEAGAPVYASDLPDVEAIEAGSDIRAFLAADVPPDLKIAALRRAWSSDPSIRDFIGLSEDPGDFNAPGAIAGFGPVEAERIQGLLERILGQAGIPRPSKGTASGSLPETGKPAGTEAETAGSRPDGSEVRASALRSHAAETVNLSPGGAGPEQSGCRDISQCDRAGAAVQEPEAPSRPAKAPPIWRRRHGGALPE